MVEAINKGGRKYSYGDYLKWHDDERWELIDGVAYNMTPAPSRKHQDISGELFRQISNYLQGKNCKIYTAPFDVRLPQRDEKEEDIETVVQPDITVICDNSKLDDKGCIGAPDFIVEILSPNTAKKDVREKFYLYERVGVKEYWIADPEDDNIMVFTLKDNGEYSRPKLYVKGEKIEPGIFEDLEIDLALVFPE
ncbi:MAG: Uma2 family endonuclease [Lutispora sp.]|nr:Uma2 family endonuclease [Lutispora sp.]